MGVFLLVVSLLPYQTILNTYEGASLKAEYRKTLYQNISQNHNISKNDRIVLVNCKRGGLNKEFVMEPSWGMRAISTMLFTDANVIALDQNYPSDALSRNVYDCEKMKLLPKKYEEYLDSSLTNLK